MNITEVYDNNKLSSLPFLLYVLKFFKYGNLFY